MDYTKTFNELKILFNPSEEEIRIPDSDIKIHNIGFRSDPPLNGFSNKTDTLITENRDFLYPVFAPRNTKTDKVILLLHGLNE